jgi:hypothetical protein
VSVLENVEQNLGRDSKQHSQYQPPPNSLKLADVTYQPLCFLCILAATPAAPAAATQSASAAAAAALNNPTLGDSTATGGASSQQQQLSAHTSSDQTLQAEGATDSRSVQLVTGDRVKLYGPLARWVAADALVKVVGVGSLLIPGKQYKVIVYA